MCVCEDWGIVSIKWGDGSKNQNMYKRILYTSLQSHLYSFETELLLNKDIPDYVGIIIPKYSFAIVNSDAYTELFHLCVDLCGSVASAEPESSDLLDPLPRNVVEGQ